MSERQKNKILAVYLILVNAGVNVSDSLKKAVEDIEKEKAARAVRAAGKKALRFMLPDDPGRPFLCRTAEGNGEEIIMPMNLN